MSDPGPPTCPSKVRKDLLRLPTTSSKHKQGAGGIKFMSDEIQDKSTIICCCNHSRYSYQISAVTSIPPTLNYPDILRMDVLSDVPNFSENIAEVPIQINVDTQKSAGKLLKRRGKAIAWRYVRTYENMAAALEEYSKTKLAENDKIRGRKSFGKSNAYYFNCQKMTCGCKKKWRLLTSMQCDEVTEEETYDEHSSHELFARNGGFGMNFDQVQLINEAVSRCPMRPLQILHYFEEKAIEASRTDPPSTVIPAPKIAQITSFRSFQKRKRLLDEQQAADDSNAYEEGS